MLAKPLLVAVMASLVLTACSGGQRRGPPTSVINRVLATAPGEAQPSKVVATEIEYAQAEKDEGAWAAGARFSTPGAIWHTGEGPKTAASEFARLPEPEGTAQWGTKTVVMSCDGALAVAAGRFRDLEGKVGDYVTTWVRQSDNSYRWSYNAAWRDDPQPPPRPQFEDGDIVVTAIDAVLGLVATCPRPGEPTPPPPALSLASDNPANAQLSGDGTLRWRWEHMGDGTKYFAVEYFYEGEWVTAVEEGLASAPEE
ncbi:MAG: hypothetical protein AAF687_05190 [Pseudomonadota bacterium]